MGIKLIKGKERLIFETEEEREVLEKARNYFGEASTLLNKGLDYKFSTKSAPSHFCKIKNGKSSNGSIVSISIENWRRTKEYASRLDREERYDPETFVRPEL